MNKVKQRLQAAHSQTSHEEKNDYKSIQQDVVEQMDFTSTKKDIIKSTQTDLPVEPKSDKKRPISVLQRAREDIPLSTYGIKPVQVGFDSYNIDVRKWLRDFSSDNQHNGGIAITKSQIVEIFLEILHYDLDIKPIGYESHQDFKDDLYNKLKNYQG